MKEFNEIYGTCNDAMFRLMSMSEEDRKKFLKEQHDILEKSGVLSVHEVMRNLNVIPIQPNLEHVGFMANVNDDFFNVLASCEE